MENLGIDGKLILAQIINFLIFFVLIKKFVAKPFISFVDDERKKEEDKNKLLQKLKESELAAIEQEKKLKEKMKKEFDDLFARAKQDAQRLRNDLVKQAESDAEEIRVKSKKLMEEEKNSLYREVKEKVIKTSVMIVESSLRDSLDDETKRKVTNRIIKNFSGKVKIYEN